MTAFGPSVAEIDVLSHRSPEAPVEPLLVRRWSPRALSGEEVTLEDLRSLFEAARWAPSSYNRQPWRFLYARRGTSTWDRFFSLLVEFNQSWAQGAGALLLLVSKTTDDKGRPSPNHSFDSGAAWQNLALQATAMGLVAHAMEGFDAARARSELGVPEDWKVEVMIAIGRPGRVEGLPEALRSREKPSHRKDLSEVAVEGSFA